MTSHPNFLALPDNPLAIAAHQIMDPLRETFDGFGKALEVSRIKMRYGRSLQIIEQLRGNLALMEVRYVDGTHTMLDQYGQMLEALEASIKHHQILWEHEHAEA